MRLYGSLCKCQVFFVKKTIFFAAHTSYTQYTVQAKIWQYLISVFRKHQLITLCFRRGPVRLAAVELLGHAFVSLTLEAAHSRNLAFAYCYSFSKLPIQLMHETVGKFRVLENSKLNLILFFDAPAKVVEQFVDTAFAYDWISAISVIPISIVKVY